MENNTHVPSANGNETIAANKKIVERSAAYPAITIEESIELVTKIYKNFTGAVAVRREDVAAVAGEASINRGVAASVQYGLLTRESGLYKISNLFLPIYQAVPGTNEKQTALITAFCSPKLYKELIGKYDKHALPTVEALSIVLFRQHGITEKASRQAAEIFLSNAKFVGAANNVGILNTASPVQLTPESEVTEPIQDAQTQTEQPRINPEIQIIEQPNVQTKILNLPEGTTEEKIIIPLTEKKKAVLIYPSNFNAKDIEVLKSQLDVLGLLLT